ncbi:MAG: hypothetical protein R3E12_09385, partial [Candidatus Eisenbacteria bacterium]
MRRILWSMLGIALVLPSASRIVRAEGPGPSSTHIVDTMVFGEQHCTIQIFADSLVCAGLVPFSAEVSCVDGLVLANEPQWFVDGDAAASGSDVQLSLDPGSHMVSVSCGSCEDAVNVEALVCTAQPHLDAAFSDDATEETTGIFLSPNLGPINGFSFASLRYLMRPFTLAADSSGFGSFELTLEGDGILELYSPTGSPIALPATFDAAALPVSFLASATGVGEATLVATFQAAAAGGAAPGSTVPGDPFGDPFVDRVKVRVGLQPGLSGEQLADHPFFLPVDTFNDD